MLENKSDSGLTEEKLDRTDSKTSTQILTDTGQKALRGIKPYADDTLEEITRINQEPVENRQKLVGKLEEENRKAWIELGNLGGPSEDGYLGPDGEVIIPYKDKKSKEQGQGET